MSRPLAEGQDSLLGLQSKIVAMTADSDEWFNLATAMTERLNASEADIALRSTLWEAARKQRDTHTSDLAELQEQLMTKGAELSQLIAKHSEPIDELICVKLQIAAEATVLPDLKLAAGNCDCPNKRARLTHQCKKSPIKPSRTTFSALLAGQEDYKIHCEALMIDSQCIFGLPAVAKKLWAKLADC